MIRNARVADELGRDSTVSSISFVTRRLLFNISIQFQTQTFTQSVNLFDEIRLPFTHSPIGGSVLGQSELKTLQFCLKSQV